MQTIEDLSILDSPSRNAKRYRLLDFGEQTAPGDDVFLHGMWIPVITLGKADDKPVRRWE
jgi:hypothetical protein